MRRLASMVTVVALFVALGSTPAQEEKVDFDKVPKAVMDVVKAKYPGAKLIGATMEKEDDKMVFEIELIYKEHHHDVTLEPDGKLVSVEREIPRKQLPAAADRAVEAKHPKATWKIVEELYKGDGKLIGYEIHLVTADNQSIEVVLDTAGKITKEEKQDPQKDK